MRDGARFQGNYWSITWDFAPALCSPYLLEPRLRHPSDVGTRPMHYLKNAK